jgi:cytochrome b6-f complex iron-sulfur subunit
MTDKDKNNAVEEPGRRSFLKKIWLLFGGVATAELAWMASGFFGPRERKKDAAKKSDIFVAGPVEQFENGTVTPFQTGKFYLVRLEDGGFMALSRKCTHLGCTVPWRKELGRFVCPCHTSTFNMKGEVEGAPAPRPLDLFAVRIENKIVKVDISAPIERSSFDPAQVTRL